MANALTDEALMPTAQSYDQLSRTFASSTFSLDSLDNNITALQDLSDKLLHAGDVIVAARKDAAAIGNSHFDAINKAVDKMRELLDQASELYESNEEVIKGVQSFLGAGSDILGALLGGSGSGSGTANAAAPASQAGASLPQAA
jgi:methyl-accepting chemotaxis protein